MNNITRQDLLIVLRFGIHLAKLEDSFVPLERKLLKRIADAIKISPLEQEELMKGDASLSAGLQNLSSSDAKNLLVKTLCAVAYSDGKAHPGEINFIEKVISKFSDSIFIYPREEWGMYEDEVIHTLSKLA